jgi:hypothetical protein
MLHGLFVIMLGFANCRAIADDFSGAYPRYVSQGGSVYDKTTGLTWARCSVGQHWEEGVGCVGIVKTFSFDDAQQEGSGVWRIPTKDELASLIDQVRADYNEKPTIDEVTFPDMDESKLDYWSSTSSEKSSGWRVSFGTGGIDDRVRSSTYAVRLVRSGH